MWSEIVISSFDLDPSENHASGKNITSKATAPVASVPTSESEVSATGSGSTATSAISSAALADGTNAV